MGEGFVMIPRALFEMDTTATDVAVYAAVAMHWSPDGKCYPSVSTLAKESKVNRCTVIRSIRRMKELGAIVCVTKDGVVNHYDLPLNRSQIGNGNGSSQSQIDSNQSQMSTATSRKEVLPPVANRYSNNNHLTKTNELNIVHAQYARALDTYRKLYGTNQLPPKQIADITENQDAFGEEIVIEAIEYGHENEKPWGWIVGRMRGRGKQREETNARVNEYAEYDRYD